VIALDASAHSARALDFVRRMRWPAGSRVMVLSIVQPVVSAVAGAFDHRTAPEAVQRRRRARDLVEQAAERLREAGIATEARIVDGDPRDVLTEITGLERVDLLVVGSHGLTGVSKLLLGSVSSHVVTHAPCSVLVVKQVGNEQEEARGHARRGGTR
jgi:nucleotide-binding universal stress UspA family protein